MADLNASIILQGRSPDILGAMSRGNALRQQDMDINRQQQMTDLYRTQGAGILAGQPGALNALAGVDPGAALGFKQTQQQMAFSAEEMQMARDEMKRAAADRLKAADAAQVAAQMAEEARDFKGLAAAYARGDKPGFAAFAASQGLEVSWEDFPMAAAGVEGIEDALKSWAPPAAPKPSSESGQLFADLKAGLITQDQFDLEMQRRAPKGMRITSDGAGGFTMEEGVGVSGTPGASGPMITENQQAATTLIDQIDAVATDPALSKVVGPYEGGGGNDVEQFGMARRAWYGGDGVALVERIAQLQGNAWLAARALLKGGGQITDYESRKAEGAMSRLSRAKGEAEFRAALKELRDALDSGMKKLSAAKPASAPATEARPDAAPNVDEMSDEELMRSLLGQP